MTHYISVITLCQKEAPRQNGPHERLYCNLTRRVLEWVMRFLMIILVFMIGFSGFSAAAHALDSQNCVGIEKSAQHDGCPQHQTGKQDDNHKSSDGKHICISCHHCCVSHAGVLHTGMTVIASVYKTTFPMVDSAVADDITFGLKRPPRSLS